MIDQELLAQEVQELTEMLRSSEVLSDLRSLLRNRGVDPFQALLAGFVEGESGEESGVIVTEDAKIFRFSRLSIEQGEFDEWESVAETRSLLESYPAIDIAHSMVSLISKQSGSN